MFDLQLYMKKWLRSSKQVGIWASHWSQVKHFPPHQPINDDSVANALHHLDHQISSGPWLLMQVSEEWSESDCGIFRWHIQTHSSEWRWRESDVFAKSLWHHLTIDNTANKNGVTWLKVGFFDFTYNPSKLIIFVDISQRRQYFRLSICRLVEFVKSEANPNNNLMMSKPTYFFNIFKTKLQNGIIKSGWSSPWQALIHLVPLSITAPLPIRTLLGNTGPW